MWKILISFFTTNREKLEDHWIENQTSKWDRLWSSVSKPSDLWWSLEMYDLKIKKILKEIAIEKPMAIHESKDHIMVSDCLNQLHFFHKINLKHTKVIKNALFNSIHSIDSSQDEITVSSTGIDSVIWFNLETWKTRILWTAIWTIFWKYSNGLYRKINFSNDHSSATYPTLIHTTHVNSCCVDWDLLYISLFHQGKIISYNMKSHKQYELISWLKNPHGIHKYYVNKEKYFIVSNTRWNEVYYDIKFKNNKLFSKKTLNWDFNWVQDAKFIESLNQILVLDSNNHRILFYNYNDGKLVDTYNYSKNKRIYDLIYIND